MKTITEYIPLVFSRIDAHAAERAVQRQRLKINAVLVTCYSVIGFWLMWDTGFTLWTWQFWACFGPWMIAAELAVYEILREREVPDCSTAQ